MKKYNSPSNLIVSSFLLSFIYSVLRYNIFGETYWNDLPLFVMNKVFALYSIILFAYYHISIIKLDLKEGKFIRDLAILIGASHILISAILISPNYFPKFFSVLNFNLIGGLSLFFGIMASGLTMLFFSKNILERVNEASKLKSGGAKLFFVLIAAHVLIMGYEGWLEPSSWPGWLPPITLLSFIIAIIPLFYKISTQRKNN